MCLCEFFAGDVADAGKFVLPSFSLFLRPRSGIVLLLKSSRLTHYTVAIQILGTASMVAPCMCDSPLRRLMSEGRIAWSRWVICWISPCVGRMWRVDGRLVPAFRLIRKMFRLGGRVYVATPLWGKCEYETRIPKSGNLESSGTSKTLELNCGDQNTLP